MVKQVRYKDLSLWLKLAAICGWAYGVVFIIGFCWGFFGAF